MPCSAKMPAFLSDDAVKGRIFVITDDEDVIPTCVHFFAHIYQVIGLTHKCLDTIKMQQANQFSSIQLFPYSHFINTASGNEKIYECFPTSHFDASTKLPL